MSNRKLLLGDEAIALGAIHAGLSGVYAYPGTPSTEITEFIQGNALARERGIHSRWSTNEKTAMEEALGMSFMGKRALVCMKHVGMNVCADPFVNSGMTGVNGGVVVLAADDPSMHSSQDEQDSRFYGKFAMIPTFEPSSQQEAYDMMAAAFDFSEQQKLPVLMRVTTRMAHSRAVVVVADEPRPQNELNYNAVAANWVLLPANARKRNDHVTAQQAELEEAAANSTYNIYMEGHDRSLGIIASGIGFNYVNECFPGGCPFPLLKVSQYPLPKKLVRRMLSECEKVLIVEEGQPFIEDILRGVSATVHHGSPRNLSATVQHGSTRFNGAEPCDTAAENNRIEPCKTVAENLRGEFATVPHGSTRFNGIEPCDTAAENNRIEPCETVAIYGKLDGTLPRTGELTPDLVKKALGMETDQCYDPCADVVPRPPALCQGCGHRDVYAALNEVLREYENARVFGDIGCYTLGFLPPFRAIHSCVDMGASITMAKGAADAGQYPAVAIIGDSTFTHSGMTGLLDAINENADITVIISDNLTTGMTGGQDSAGTNKFEAICRGLGLSDEHLKVVVPLPKNMPEITQIIRDEINYHGTSVIIPRRECMQTLQRHLKQKKANK
jgi:TPP-dependent indolepyruvate ferredoxin oxidoreductase alpha subunit